LFNVSVEMLQLVFLEHGGSEAAEQIIFLDPAEFQKILSAVDENEFPTVS